MASAQRRARIAILGALARERTADLAGQLRIEARQRGEQMVEIEDLSQRKAGPAHV